MSRRLWVVAWAVSFVAGLGSARAEDGPANDSPELAVLDRYVGSWETGGESSGKSSTQWVLDGRMISTEYTMGDGTTGLILRKYDAAAKLFKSWFFDSNGGEIAMEGTWDAAAQTLRMEGAFEVPVGAETAELTIVVVSHFTSADREEWSITVTDAQGSVLSEIRGVNERLGE